MTARVGFIIGALFIFGAAEANEFQVTELNNRKTRAIVESQGSLELGDRLSFTDKFAEVCTADVVKVDSKSVVLDISNCKNYNNVTPGSQFTKSTIEVRESIVEPKKSKPIAPSGAPTIDESWYILWGFGFSRPKYGDDSLEKSFAKAEAEPGVTRSRLAYDFFGFYWPTVDRMAMQGFILNTVSDSLDGLGVRVTVSQYQYSYSYQRFYGANIGDGWFWRGDVGVVRYVTTIDSFLSTRSESSETGLGILGGGGYAIPLGIQTRMLFGGYLTYNKVKDDSVSNLSIIASFLF